MFCRALLFGTSSVLTYVEIDTALTPGTSNILAYVEIDAALTLGLLEDTEQARKASL
jgi:hypothetical protein